MSRWPRRVALWGVLSGAMFAAVLVPLLAMGGSGETSFTATLYADVIRFEANGAASLRVTIYDLSENELWDSGVVFGDTVDWDRTNEQGERLANGYYLYVAQAWDASERLILNKTGKVVLLPGDRVELKTAPVASSPPGEDPWRNDDPPFGPKAYDTTDWHVSNRIGVGTDAPAYPFHVKRTTLGTAFAVEDNTGYTLSFYSDNSGNGTMWIKGGGANKIKLTGSGDSYMNGGNVYMTGGNFGVGTASPSYPLHLRRTSAGTAFGVQDPTGYALSFYTDGEASGTLWIKGDGSNTLKLTGEGDSYVTGGNLGVGTASPTTTLDVAGTGRFTGAVTVGAYALPTADGTNEQVLTTDGSGTVSWQTVSGSGTSYWTLTGDDIYNSNAGNVGIGDTTPQAALTVESDDASNPAILGTNTNGYNGVLGAADGSLAGVCGFNNGDPGGPGLFGWSYNSTGLLANSAGGTNIIEARDGNGTTGDFGDDIQRFRVERDGDVYVDGDLTIGAYTLPNSDGTNGQVLATNGSGALSWTTVAAGSSNWTLSGNDLYNDNSGNVGIGDSTPDQKLDVAGSIELQGALYLGTQVLLHATGTTNTFVGVNAGDLSIAGSENTGVGRDALGSNVDGWDNTAVGYSALSSNVGSAAWNNTAVGARALSSNTDGGGNTAVGTRALLTNTAGSWNTALGPYALHASTGNHSTALGYKALQFLGTGSSNIAIGSSAGLALTSGSHNIYIDNAGQATESNTIRIGNSSFHSAAFMAGTRGVSVTGGEYVVIDANGQLGSTASAGSGYWTASGDDIYNSNSGNVGIGDTTPSEKLEVDGNIGLSGYIYVDGSRFVHNYGGSTNTFVGANAGNLSLTQNRNTGIGSEALMSLTSGENNTAVGELTLKATTTGSGNTAVGQGALDVNTTGDSNTAVGKDALGAAAGSEATENCAFGEGALASMTTGSDNIGIGYDAGNAMTSGWHNIYLGNAGQASESNTIRIGRPGGGDTDHNATYIAGIYGVTVATGIHVYMKSDGQLGTTTSSMRFKTGIADLGSTSDVLYDLRPVTFAYKPEIDPAGIPQYGLIAEEVAEVAPDLVIYDDVGDPYTVRYEQLVPLLLNELQRLNERVAALEAEVGTPK